MFNIPAPRTASEAAFQARIQARALTLFSQGYRYQQFGKSPVYAIFKPGNDDTRNGYRDYCVDMTPHKETCTCDCFAEHGYCKHGLAIVEVLSDKAQAEQFDRMMQECEDETMGIDPYGEY